MNLFFLWSSSVLFSETQAPVFNNNRFSEKQMDRQVIKFKTGIWQSLNTCLNTPIPLHKGNMGVVPKLCWTRDMTGELFKKIPMSRSYLKQFKSDYLGMGGRYQYFVKIRGDSNIKAKFGNHYEDRFSLHFYS